MDIDYTCGHKFQMQPGDFPANCPQCGKGMAVGLKEKLYMSDSLSQKLRDAVMAAPTLEQLGDFNWWSEKAGTASHYCPTSGQFYDSKLHSCCIPCPTKPEPKEWDGEGRPPVNTRCLARCKHQWRTGTVVWHREGNDVDAVVLEDDGVTTFWSYAFRPILDRLKEQREREEVVRSAAHVIEMKNGSPITLYLKYCEDLYDAGMLRKGAE